MTKKNSQKNDPLNKNPNQAPMPMMLSPYRCPHCGEINLVPTASIQYECRQCGQKNSTCDLIFWQ